MEINRWYTYEIRPSDTISIEKPANLSQFARLLIKQYCQDDHDYRNIILACHYIKLDDRNFLRFVRDLSIRNKVEEGTVLITLGIRFSRTLEVMFIDPEVVSDLRHQIDNLQHQVEVLQELLDRPGNAGMKYGWEQCAQLLQ